MFLWKLVTVNTVLLEKRKRMQAEIHELPLYSCNPEVAIKTTLRDKNPVMSQQLVHNLSAWSFELHVCEVNGDGNCLLG